MNMMRYELRVAGRMSELAGRAFAGMHVVPLAPQSIIYGQVSGDDELHALLTLCQDMGLQVIALHEIPSSVVTAEQRPGYSA